VVLFFSGCNTVYKPKQGAAVSKVTFSAMPPGEKGRVVESKVMACTKNTFYFLGIWLGPPTNAPWQKLTGDLSLSKTIDVSSDESITFRITSLVDRGYNTITTCTSLVTFIPNKSSSYFVWAELLPNRCESFVMEKTNEESVLLELSQTHDKACIP
jgi:hypothetical protein